jgi:hypothetical protein
MRAPVIRASFNSAWSFGCLSHASSSRRCSSTDRIRVRRFCSLKRFTPLAGESTRYFHSTALERMDFNVSSSRFTVPGLTGLADRFCLNARQVPFNRSRLNCSMRCGVISCRIAAPKNRLSVFRISRSRLALRLCRSA